MKAVTVICTVVFTLATVHALHYPQYYQLFKHNSCLGDPLADLLDSATDLTQIPGLNQAKSQSKRGLWRINYEEGYILTMSQSTVSCSSPVHQENNPLKSIIRVVPGDLDDSVLSLYSGAYYVGESEVVNGTEAKFAKPLKVGSWAFTGIQNFTLYARDNFTGEVACLVPPAYVELTGWGVSADWNTTASGTAVTIQSVKLGCDQNVPRRYYGVLDKSHDGTIIHNNSNNRLQEQKIPDVKWL